MSTPNVTKITPSNSDAFLETNKDAFIVLLFDGDFSDSKEIVDGAIKALVEAEDLKDKIVLGFVDVSENNDLTTKFSVLSVPIACMIKGKTIRKVDDLEPTKLVNIVGEELKRHSILSLETGDKIQDPKEKLNQYLKQLISRAPVMIFMKGEPKAPRCGFSRQLVEILSKYDISYETFDILQDEEVRQGLKDLSDWPTYPQIYAKGEFVGGLDILKQLEESGELEATLKI